MDMGTDLDQAAAFTLRIGPLARAAAELDDPTKAKIAEAVKEALAASSAPTAPLRRRSPAGWSPRGPDAQMSTAA